MVMELATTRPGRLTPSSHPVLEPPTAAMLHEVPDVSAPSVRFRVTTVLMGTDDFGHFTTEPRLAAAELRADAKGQSVSWNGIYSEWLGFHPDTAPLARSEMRAQRHTRRIARATPSLPEIETRIIATYANHWFEGAAERQLDDLGTSSNATCSQKVVAVCCDVEGAQPEATAIFFTNFCTAGMAEISEPETEIPVLHSVSAAFWKSTQVAGHHPSRIQGWGRAFHV